MLAFPIHFRCTHRTFYLFLDPSIADVTIFVVTSKKARPVTWRSSIDIIVSLYGMNKTSESTVIKLNITSSFDGIRQQHMYYNLVSITLGKRKDFDRPAGLS